MLNDVLCTQLNSIESGSGSIRRVQSVENCKRSLRSFPSHVCPVNFNPQAQSTLRRCAHPLLHGCSEHLSGEPQRDRLHWRPHPGAHGHTAILIVCMQGGSPARLIVGHPVLIGVVTCQRRSSLRS
jgi:hypothetical protein